MAGLLDLYDLMCLFVSLEATILVNHSSILEDSSVDRFTCKIDCSVEATYHVTLIPQSLRSSVCKHFCSNTNDMYVTKSTSQNCSLTLNSTASKKMMVIWEYSLTSTPVSIFSTSNLFLCMTWANHFKSRKMSGSYFWQPFLSFLVFLIYK